MDGPYKVEFRKDFNGDGKAEVFLISWKKIKDYAVNRSGKRSTEKYVWYQANVRIVSTAGKVCHDDIFSMKEVDFRMMAAIIERENMSARFYFDHFFDIPDYESTLNGIESRRISTEELDMEYVGKLIKRKKVHITPEAVAAELTTNDHAVVFYRRDWREDLGIIVYSKLLDHFVFLISPYAH